METENKESRINFERKGKNNDRTEPVCMLTI